ncbi:hypothetical protein AB0D16_18985 [Streptomyces sp. NPDC048161]|uniref:zinc finger domain-containing protein n=1 Tax=unclassified Streptomyces TaxID=2593676 RepID=UPI00081B9637|nr:hypothetical protein [Streptomyces sp. DvalAA-43]MYQ82632.1 hypothetical protein [Streptomyces sp. SID4936]SCD47777.1 hypothetical protein GA0115234_1016196 [Streptomyces sp. DvalAA-43]
MDRREIAALLAYIGRLDPRTIRTDRGEARDQLAQWHELLDNVPMATPHGWDARTVARQHIRLSPYQILPADIGRPWESYRRDRLGQHTDPTPSVDPDDQAAWTAELVGTRHAVAFGTAQPAQARAITSGRRQIDPELEARLREIGSCIPPAARATLMPYRPARAAREAAVAAGKSDVLSVRCPWCRAQPGAPCFRSSARGNVPLGAPHPSRRDLADAERAQAPEQPALA